MGRSRTIANCGIGETPWGSQEQTRIVLRNYLIETLLFDYAVEYDVYAITQRLGYLGLIAQVSPSSSLSN